MTDGGGLLSFSENPLLNRDFKISYEFHGEYEDWITRPMIEQVKSFVNYAVDILSINSTWSKYKELLVILEETESEDLDGICIDNGEKGVIKIFLYETVESIKNLLVTVAHELVHVRQFCDRRLSRMFKRVNESVVGCYSWTPTCEIYYGEEDVITYRTLPWEVEAYDIQETIVEAYSTYAINDQLIR